MDHFNRLPEEILYLIFSEIDNKQLLELENVCRNWKSVLRSRVQYWNSEIELDCQSIDHAKGWKQFTLKILSRSKGEMQSWRIKVASSALKCYQDLFEQIPTSNPHSLDIEITDLDHYSSDHQDNRISERECSILMNTIKQCSSLKSLKIKADPDLTVSFGSDMEDCPIASCKLETLKLDNVDIESVLDDFSIFSMVSQAKHIDLIGRYGLVDVFPLIELAKDTLEVCSVYLLARIRYDSTIRSPIILPRLKKLQIYSYHGSTTRISWNHNDSLQCSLMCPNLRHLTLSGDNTFFRFADLFTGSIETLYLELDEHFCTSLRNKIRKCSNLSTLRITFDYPYEGAFSTGILEEVLNELILLPISEFVLSFMARSNWENEQIILNFFRKWSNDSKKMRLFLLYQDVQLPKEILEELSKYCEVVKAFARDQEDSIYSEEELQLRTYGYSVGR